MCADKLKKRPWEVKLIPFSCKITSPTGRVTFTEIPLIPIVEKAGTAIFKDDVGNIFEYELVGYKGKVYQPNLAFEAFKESPRWFADCFTREYFRIFKLINMEHEEQQDLLSALKDIQSIENKELFKKYLKAKHLIYFGEYERIYNENVQRMTNITPEELQYIESFKKHKITRFTAFLVLLFRHKDDRDFLISCKFDDVSSVEEQYRKFSDAYNHRNRATKNKRKPTYKKR